MKNNLTRRSFIVNAGTIGLFATAGSFFPGFITGSVEFGSSLCKKQKNSSKWIVRKELYAPSPEPRTGISLSMSYIGNGLKREEIHIKSE